MQYSLQYDTETDFLHCQTLNLTNPERGETHQTHIKEMLGNEQLSVIIFENIFFYFNVLQ